MRVSGMVGSSFENPQPSCRLRNFRASASLAIAIQDFIAPGFELSSHFDIDYGPVICGACSDTEL